MASTIARTAGSVLFGENARAYATFRPGYPERVFDILRARCGAGEGRTVFEVGAGTGLATAPLLAMGCRVTAVEPDAKLAALLVDSQAAYAERLAVQVGPFEEAALSPGSFDLGIAATSLHWVDPDLALTKAFHLLHPGGHWAMWWNIFGDSDEPDAFQQRTHALFERLSKSPSHGDGPKGHFGLDRKRRIAELEQAGFRSIVAEELRWRPVLNRQQILGLTATFSPVARLPEIERQAFLGRLGAIVDEEFGGRAQRHFMTAIYVARRP
ncbi:class I SAM-dependent methyltransferase [Labrys portucalensis]|uniref:Class I SAM-dependent methyltransferase n=1 Tax=Labrys neptuniae TaxID=376174 RepID=A0ABV6ZA44_9HYPH